MPRALAIGALVALVPAGCGGAEPAHEAPMGAELEARARSLVWDDVFQAGLAPPPVEWRQDDCGGPLAGVRHGGRCYAGLYLRDDRALVAWRGRFPDTAYAHELMHALQWFRGVEDPEHAREEWRLVDRANEALAEEGL